MDCSTNLFCLGQILTIGGFILFFLIIRAWLQKKIDFKQTIIVLGTIVFSIADKNFPVFWFDSVDLLWHLNPENINAGFPAYFVFKDLIDFFSFNLGLYVLPLIFSAMISYIFLVWLNKKNINLWVLLFLCFFFFKQFMFFIATAREPIIILFSLLFFYFLEKHYYKNSRKNLVAATLFLILACLTKITGFLLIPFYLWVLMQKQRSNYYLIPIAIILLFMFFKTNLAANLHGGDNFVSLNLILVSFSVIMFSHFVAWFFVFFFPFFKPNNFLWQLNAYVFVLILVVGVKTYFLTSLDRALTLLRYFVIFLLPLILWLSIEFNIFIKKFKQNWRFLNE